MIYTLLKGRNRLSALVNYFANLNISVNFNITIYQYPHNIQCIDKVNEILLITFVH